MTPKYKDSSPDDTIKRAQNILQILGFKISETFLQPTKNLYSLRLSDCVTGWGFNGKGTSEEYCRASAYGEALERILNFHFPDYAITENEADAFCYYPDEIDMKITPELLPTDIYLDMQKSFYDAENKVPEEDELISIWQQWNGGKTCKALPFFSITKQKVVHLPFNILRRLCRSNGIAAGNSIPEAVCQAICEIFERHTFEIILTKHLTPPEISHAYISTHYIHIKNLINEIENCGLKVHMFDGSLGKDIPVICALVIDQKFQSYRLKVGCHPKMEIAMERCLTEFAQGNDISQKNKSKMFVQWNDITQNHWDTFHNWSNNFRSNTGSVPDTFFYAKSSWKFRDWDFVGNYDNLQGCSLLIKKCLEISSDVYIRDNSSSGFCAVRVYVPSITMVHKFNPLSQRTLLDNHIKNIIYNFKFHSNSLNSEDKTKLLELFSVDHHAIYDERLGVTVPVLLAALYMDKGDHKSALISLCKEQDQSVFIKAVICDLKMEFKNYDLENRDHLLSLFFGNKILSFVKSNWRNGDVTAGLFDPYRLNSIRGIQYKTSNLLDDWIRLIHKTKALFIQYPIEQRNLKNVFKFD